MPVEMHCHTAFSVDAHGTPEALVDVASERGISALAITEHNHLGSLERGRARALERGIRYIPGVELDASWKDRNLHLLALGFDAETPALRARVEENFSTYSLSFELYLEQFEANGLDVTREELTAALAKRYASNPAPVLNQWFARDYFVEKGLFPDKDAAREFLGETKKAIVAAHGPDDLRRRFGTVEATCEIVHGAGGVLVLAHVANYFPGQLEAQVKLIRSLLEVGLDGFELYHPTNVAEAHFDGLVKEAERTGCVVTGGSDCHNASAGGNNALGSSRVPDAILTRLDEALNK